MTRNALWTVPNILTIVRILLTPLFVVAYAGENFNLAWILFAVAGLTDAFDGFLARIWDQRTQLGAVLDPLADKALLVTSFICLAAKGWIPFWFAVLVVSRDVIIVGGLAVLSFLGVDVKNRIRPIWISKFNTAAQIVLVVAVMIHRTFGLDYGYFLGILLAVTGLSTVLSGIAYVRRGFEIFSLEAEGQ